MTHDLDESTTAAGLARCAFDYIDAALIVEAEHSRRNPQPHVPSMTAYILLHRGMELTLKAYLRHKGLTDADIGKRLDHGLLVLYQNSKDMGLSGFFNEAYGDFGALKRLVDLNGERHQLHYPEVCTTPAPYWGQIESVAVRLFYAVAPLAEFTRSPPDFAPPSAFKPKIRD